VIRDQTHLVSILEVTDADTEFRITISFLDAPTAEDGLVPLFGELSLVVESPDGFLYRGNQHPLGTEEHFSTHQRVILYPGQFAPGTYTIHVIANLVEDLFDEVKFAAVARGAIANESLVFSQTTTCLDCDTGECNSTTGLCSCSNGTLGQSCSLPVIVIPAGSEREINVSSGGNAYLSLTKPEEWTGNLSFTIEVVDQLSLGNYDWIHLYFGLGETPSAFPRDYDQADWGIALYENWLVVPPGRDVVSILIHHPLWWQATYRISTQWDAFSSVAPTVTPTVTPPPTDAPTSADSTTAKILTITLPTVFGAVLIIVVVVVLVYCHNKKKKDETTQQAFKPLV
jgi:hypothetical protein